MPTEHAPKIQCKAVATLVAAVLCACSPEVLLGEGLSGGGAAAGGQSGVGGSGSAVGAPTRPGRKLLFFDDFESGDTSHTENGVGWGSMNAGQGESLGVADGVARGAHAMRFAFGGGAADDDGLAEAHFGLGELRDDLWIGFQIYFPDGTEAGENRYIHRSVAPDNNSLVRAWAPDIDGFKWGASMRSNNVGLSQIEGDTRATCTQGVGAIAGSDRFSMSDSDLGRWTLWEIHLKGDDGTGNGTFEFWRDGVPVISHTDVAVQGAPCAPNAFLAGFLLGWSNSGFDSDTNVYVDDVAIWIVE